jgi:hypothetical protein
MEIELAATHEAGHTVMQWLVGWEVGELQMTVDGANATKLSACCRRLPLTTLSDLRRRLLVLFAGNAVTMQRWPGKWNDGGDWKDALLALAEYFQRGMKWVACDSRTLFMQRFQPALAPPPEKNRTVEDPEANLILQDAIARCDEMVAHPLFRAATEQVASAFIGAAPGEDGVTRLEGPAAVAICEAVGAAFRADNPWSAWMAGERG